MTASRKIQLLIDDETRPIWECAKRAAAEVAAWPKWKRRAAQVDVDLLTEEPDRDR